MKIHASFAGHVCVSAQAEARPREFLTSRGVSQKRSRAYLHRGIGGVSFLPEISLFPDQQGNSLSSLLRFTTLRKNTLRLSV